MTTILENGSLRLELDPALGGLATIANRLTGERYAAAGDAFAVETTGFRREQPQMRPVAWNVTGDRLTARYADDDLEAEVVYELRPGNHTEEKVDGDLRSLEFCSACGLDGVSDCHPWEHDGKGPG